MNQFEEFFSDIFATDKWPARWYCGEWSDFLGWLYIGSDVMIWLAYFIIPIILFWFIQRRPGIPFLPVFWLFAAFILMCGTTHVLDAGIFWWPVYRLSALLRFITAIVSIVTVFALIRDLPKALDIASESLVKKDRVSLEKIIESKDQQIRELEIKIQAIQKNM